MTCALCKALRKPLPRAARRWLETHESRAQAKRKPATAPTAANPPPQDVQ